MEPATRNFRERSPLTICCCPPRGGECCDEESCRNLSRSRSLRCQSVAQCCGHRHGGLAGCVWQGIVVVLLVGSGHPTGPGCRRACTASGRTGVVAVHRATRRGRRVRWCTALWAGDRVLVLGTHLKRVQRRSCFGRSSSTTVGRQGRFRGRRVDGRRRFLPEVHRQVLVVVPADQR